VWLFHSYYDPNFSTFHQSLDGSLHTGTSSRCCLEQLASSQSLRRSFILHCPNSLTPSYPIFGLHIDIESSKDWAVENFGSYSIAVKKSEGATDDELDDLLLAALLDLDPQNFEGFNASRLMAGSRTQALAKVHQENVENNTNTTTAEDFNKSSTCTLPTNDIAPHVVYCIVVCFWFCNDARLITRNMLLGGENKSPPPFPNHPTFI
jgi:hypothetical protein